MAQQNIPVTVQGSFQYPGVTAVIGDQYYSPQQGTPANSYWYLVVDLTNLSVVVNEASQAFDSVPGDVAKYEGNPQYLLIVVTNNLISGNIPQGPLASFLMKTGASIQLARMEQIIAQLGTGSFVWVSYILAATMNENDGGGFEEFDLNNPTVMTFQLMPVTVNGQTIYTPITLGA